MLFVFVAIGGVASVLRTPISPTLSGVDEASLASEAGSVNQTIDTHLKDVAYTPGDTNRLAMAAPDESINPDEEIDLLLTQAKGY